MKRLKFLLSQRIYLSLVGVVTIGLIVAAYLVASVLDTPLTDRGKEVTVEMAYTGGLYEGSPVTYRGVKIGKISKIQLTDDGVEATAKLITTEDIPVNSDVKVRSLSPVGEQYLDFQPHGTKGPFLEDGDRIHADQVQLPKTLAETVVSIKGLLDQINADHIQTALGQIAIGLQGTSEDVGRLVDQGIALLKDLDANWPRTERLLRNGNTVLHIAPSERDNIATLARSGRDFASFLKNYDPTFRKLLEGAPAQLDQVSQLLDDAQKILPALLDRTIELNDTLAARDPHLRALLQNYARGVGSLANTFRHGELVLRAMFATQEICSYGTTRRQPTDTTRHDFQTGGHCPASFPAIKRGAAHAPPPLW